MSEYLMYFGLGKDHILDYVNGYDHILFVIALCTSFQISEWKKILILITAFTVGHSITLLLATLKIIAVNVGLIEFLIPLTIFITALINMLPKSFNSGIELIKLNYVFTLFFGLIHGMGFSTYLQGILGKKQNIVPQLLSFNVGLEIGQIIIVVFFLFISFIAINKIKVKQKYWTIFISVIIAIVALLLMKDRIPIMT